MGVKPEDIQRAVAGGNKVLSQLYPKGQYNPIHPELPATIPMPNKRIRQRTKPLSNKLETEFGAWLRQQVPGAKAFYEQAITVRLCNGVRYSPDWVVLYGAEVFCYEVKGRHVWDDSIVKLKVAASSFPEWYWHLAWKQDGQWQVQGVLP